MKKRMLSITSLIFIVAVIASLCLVAGCNNGNYNYNDDGTNGSQSNGSATQEQEEEIPTLVETLGVIADTGIIPSTAIYSTKSKYYTSQITNLCYHGILEYSEAIFLSAVDEYIASGVKNILLLGDLTHDKNQDAIDVIKQGLDKFKAAGINVYTTIGMCDVVAKPHYFSHTNTNNVTAWNSENFKSDFFDYMGSEPYSQDSGSYSYAINIPNSKLSLISFDATAGLYSIGPLANCHQVRQDNNEMNWGLTVTNAQVQWFENALKTALYSGRTPIVATYFPFDDKICDYMGASTNETIILCDRYKELRKLCTKYHVTAVFNSQIHMAGEGEYTDQNGTFQEFSTGSQCTYPLPITTYDYMSNGKFVCHLRSMSAVNESYLPSYTSESDRSAVTINAVSFAKQRVIDGFIMRSEYNLYGKDIYAIMPVFEDTLTTLTLYDASDPVCTNVVNSLSEWAYECDDLPLYGGNRSVESICKSYGLTLPASNYANVRDFVCEMVCDLYDGTFDMSSGSTNQTIFRYSFYSGLYLLAYEYDVFGLLKSLDSTVISCDMMPIVDKMFTDNVLDITINDMICSLMSVIAVPVNRTLKAQVIQVADTASYLEVFDSLLLIALPLMGDDYNATEGTVWGINYKEIADMKNGILYGDKFFDGIGAQFISRNAVLMR